MKDGVPDLITLSTVWSVVWKSERTACVAFRGTVILGFEQANRYTVLDQDGNVVALMAEDTGSIGKAIGRQLLRTRRSFSATVFSPDGADTKATAFSCHTSRIGCS